MSLFRLSLVSGGLFAAGESPKAAEGKTTLPRLVDLGADKCIPCKMMAPILAGLAKDYAGQLEVVFIDVWKNAARGEPYGIRVILTQIFVDAAGQERFRHEGFMPQKDILTKWQELGRGRNGCAEVAVRWCSPLACGWSQPRVEPEPSWPRQRRVSPPCATVISTFRQTATVVHGPSTFYRCRESAKQDAIGHESAR